MDRPCFCGRPAEYEVTFLAPSAESGSEVFCRRHAWPWLRGEGSCPAEVERLAPAGELVGSEKR